jgi:hypothetical protein
MLFTFWQVLTAILISIAMSMALAHLLELPGKMRLSREAYMATQPIYYPGFTIGGGVGEFGGVIATIILLLLTPFGTPRFWLIVVALIGLIAMQVIFWFVTQPVNRFWLHAEKLGKAGTAFFSVGTKQSRSSGEIRLPEWTDLRDRWEYSHVARAGFALMSMVAIVTAIASSR